MDPILCEFVLNKIQSELDDVNVLSKKYIFDRKYAEHRNENTLISGELGFETRLSFVVRCALTEEIRANIFHSIFDLGNVRPHESYLCSRSKLATELSGYLVTGEQAKDLFDTIFRGVFKITRTKIEKFSSKNQLKTLKVIKTLYLLSIKRHSRLMQLLLPPKLGGKFSYSLRSDFPYKKNQEQAWLIADLQVYLSIELDKEVARRVNLFFHQVNKRFGKLIQETEKNLEQISAYSVAKNISNFDLLNGAIDNFDVQPRGAIFELDHELFVHVSKLPFLHYAVGYRRLLEYAKPNLKVIPILDEFIQLIQEIFPSLNAAATKHHAVIAVEEISEFILRWENEILKVVSRAFGNDFKLYKLETIMQDILSTFRLYNLFRFGLRAEFGLNIKFSFWDVFAAVCSVLYSKNHPLTFRPFWLGQTRQGGSLNNSNFISSEEFADLIDLAPEEHRFILISRMEWFVAALDGNADLVNRKFDLRSTIVEKLFDCCCTNDMDQISQSFTNLEEYIDRKVANFAMAINYRQKFVHWFLRSDQVIWNGLDIIKW